ncbi:tripartite tricarboxylate transporter TctB family protein [Notoacmeibacter sp. MSK16QG-6]|uniref:tripartite tricarboxylate transporter TctB family protein n=1 Tax=Notoacmeibacter sp. MSK16QG-6 TaxID=2957982 RepID=UPI0020A18C8F|nr:tripartite tricarboxylate transporter TctB family protein [Notoacmeibacter sp. MSK16QG-6]MCP1199119.1 tripartite tricarboxylate transporter TctB family protein [Notoacmeibacter sp. MSK16QG-6]
MSDRIFGGIGLVLALIYAWQAAIIQESFLTDTVGPKMFPFIIAAMMGLSSIYFLLKPDPEPHWPHAGRLAEIGLAALVLAAYAELLPVAGFLISTAIAATYLTWRLGSKIIESLIIGVGTSVGIYVIFRLVLGLSLARGPFGF